MQQTIREQGRYRQATSGIFKPLRRLHCGQSTSRALSEQPQRSSAGSRSQKFWFCFLLHCPLHLLPSCCNATLASLHIDWLTKYLGVQELWIGLSSPLAYGGSLHDDGLIREMVNTSASSVHSVTYPQIRRFSEVLLRKRAERPRQSSRNGRWYTPVEKMDRTISQTVISFLLSTVSIAAFRANGPESLSLHRNHIWSPLPVLGAFPIAFENKHGFAYLASRLGILGYGRQHDPSRRDRSFTA